MEPTICPTCRAQASGKFCSSCGTPLGPTPCAGCGASLTPGAQFCHRCGRPTAGGGRGRSHGKAPWIFAAVASVVLVGYVIYIVNRGVEVAPPPAGR
ncbi:MAG: zinc ribbon domain-containing protein, partial [Gemmatimonadetes bacterium]|nr:zinc ribbon domain-containing protein [Gemmatimonadota bacterium]